MSGGCIPCAKKASTPLGMGSTTTPSEPPNTTAQGADMGNNSQSFALQTSSGQTQSFGSRLERSAFQRRNGGTILS